MSRSERSSAAWRPGLLGLCVAAALAAGCASPSAPPVAPVAPGVEAWAGRFAVDWSSGAPLPRQDRASGRFTLRSAGERTELEVFSPFGQTVARALAGPGGATLETADGRVFQADDAEALTEFVLGWRAPVERLPAWLRSPQAGRQLEDDWEVLVEPPDGDAPLRMTLRWPAPGHTPALRATPPNDVSAPPSNVRIRLLLDPAPPESAR